MLDEPNKTQQNTSNHEIVFVEPQSVDKQLKIHIDSNLIKSNSSALPDELKDLGVCAYNENDFEKVSTSIFISN